MNHRPSGRGSGLTIEFSDGLGRHHEDGGRFGAAGDYKGEEVGFDE